jgi:hypothetical protein
MKKSTKLTKEKIELAAKYLATSNLCTLDQALNTRGAFNFTRADRAKQLTDIPSLQRAVDLAVDIAIEGSMEGMAMDGGGDLDRYETKAINSVEAEIRSFRSDLKAGGKRAKYWIETLQKEIPFLFASN